MPVVFPIIKLLSHQNRGYLWKLAVLFNVSSFLQLNKPPVKLWKDACHKTEHSNWGWRNSCSWKIGSELNLYGFSGSSLMGIQCCHNVETFRQSYTVLIFCTCILWCTSYMVYHLSSWPLLLHPYGYPLWMPTASLASNSSVNPKKDIMKEFSSHLEQVRSSPLIQKYMDNQKNHKVTAISVMENQK